MTDSFSGPLLLALVSVAALMVVDFRSFHGPVHAAEDAATTGGTSHWRMLFKPLAALAFIWLALNAGALASVYGHWMLAALTLCLLGDLCLMFENERSFLAGLVAFLCGHLLYAVAFLQLEANLAGLAILALPAAALLVGSLSWLQPHLPQHMRIPVIVYIVVITGMLLCASLRWGLPGSFFVIGGAAGFALSDLAVARRQFVHPSPWNGLWGTPLYFGSQLLLAASIAVINNNG